MRSFLMAVPSLVPLLLLLLLLLLLVTPNRALTPAFWDSIAFTTPAIMHHFTLPLKTEVISHHSLQSHTFLLHSDVYQFNYCGCC